MYRLNTHISIKPGPDRIFYGKATLVVYAAWGLAFLLIGVITTHLPKINLALFIDRQIPLMCHFVWFYVLLYTLPLVFVAVCRNGHLFNRNILSIMVAGCVAFVFFILIPVEVPRHYPSDGFSAKILQAIYKLDSLSRSNNFPSLHVAFTWIFYLSFNAQFRCMLLRVAGLMLAVMISASTVLVKQHLVADAVAGLALAICSWFWVKRMYAKTDPHQSTPSKKLKSILQKNIKTFLWSAAAGAILSILRWSILP
jgi:membrane-associated phospholipid phosphatase